MQYNEIYNICQPVMDWLKEHYPHDYKIIIDTSSAELVKCGEIIALDRTLQEIRNNDKSSLEIIEEHREWFSSDEEHERAKKEVVAAENALKFLFGEKGDISSE